MCGLTETTRHCAGDKQLTTTAGWGHLLATGRDVYCLSFRCCLFSRWDRWPRRAGDRLGHLGAAIFERGTASNVARMWSALIQSFEIYLRCPDTTISQPMAQQPSCTTDRRLTSQPGPACGPLPQRFRCHPFNRRRKLRYLRVHTSPTCGDESKEREAHACRGLTGPCPRGRRRGAALGRLELDCGRTPRTRADRRRRRRRDAVGEAIEASLDGRCAADLDAHTLLAPPRRHALLVRGAGRGSDRVRGRG
jgi:hypothetical protein